MPATADRQLLERFVRARLTSALREAGILVKKSGIEASLRLAVRSVCRSLAAVDAAAILEAGSADSLTAEFVIEHWRAPTATPTKNLAGRDESWRRS